VLRPNQNFGTLQAIFEPRPRRRGRALL
jgi:hypothetical protein